MIIKSVLFALLATSGAVVTVQSQKSSEPGEGEMGLAYQEPGALLVNHGADLQKLVEQIEQLQERVEALAEEVEEAGERTEEAERQVEDLEEELEYCEKHHVTRGRDRGNCTPSRSLLVHFKRALIDQDNERLAKRIARDVTETIGDNNNSLNSYTWRLLTKSGYKGKHNDLALVLAERMQSRPKQLNHMMLDTIALAKFRTGYVDEAIKIQKRAIKRCGGSRDYAKRLKMYEDKKAECATSNLKRIN